MVREIRERDKLDKKKYATYLYNFICKKYMYTTDRLKVNMQFKIKYHLMLTFGVVKLAHERTVTTMSTTIK